MFDFAWSEIALIGVVALVLIGPKDLPIAIKAVSQTIKKARRMAGEFQTHVDEMMRDADLSDVRNSINELRRMDIKGQILKAVDDDGSIRSSLSNPITDLTPPPVPVHDTVPVSDAAPEEAALGQTAEQDTVIAAAPAGEPETAPSPAPAFVPPGYAPKPARPLPPAFIPPAAAKLHEPA